MSMWMRRSAGLSTVDGPQIPARNAPSGLGYAPSSVTPDTALRNSAVWACLRLRADLMSTFPCDTYRKVNLNGTTVRVEVPKPLVLVEPGGEHWDYVDWMWASQFDQDRCGNSVGLITERYGNNLPARIDLQPTSACTVIHRKGESQPRYRIDGTEYTADKVWHERQFPVAGTPVGLSPVAYAAWTLSENLTMQDFARQWFSNSAVPRGRLRNTQKKLEPKEARIIKNRHKASLQHGDLFVHGVDWEYNLMQAEQAGMEFIEAAGSPCRLRPVLRCAR
ncbi:phage portal protein [Micromonospora sp. 4G55]|uniref:phage portal protein n=1 Tax=Micromonospora sp. 4G55 TaxID=2806102 RepID=UPI001A642EFF|nr:phage portal protein [Micromonospora sp. 4G55]MBM0257375.1 phage portal protein [Micromonospora sp. 4G55]